MRITRSVALLLALLFAVRTADAQGIVGIVADSAANEPLRCVDVALEDSTDHVLAWSASGDEGTFRFDSSSPNAHHLRFSVWHHAPIVAPLPASSSTDGAPTRYRLVFRVGDQQKPKLWPDTTDSPPGRILLFPPEGLRYPPQLRKSHIEGGVTARYALDASGFVDRASIRILASSDPEFSIAVAKFLQEVQLSPARREGKPVCALVWEQPFNFNVKE